MSKKRILIIDDDEAILYATSLILELQGYLVETHTSSECLDTLKKYPDLILLDVLLSGEDGRDICKRLKKQVKTKNIPIILFSANTKATVEKNQKEIMNDGFLEKPFEISHLLKAIERHTH